MGFCYLFIVRFFLGKIIICVNYNNSYKPINYENKMTEEKSRKCVIQDGKNPELYAYGFSSYSGIEYAEIFDYCKLPECIKNNNVDYKIIFLDSEEGLELKTKIMQKINKMEPLRKKLARLEKLIGIFNK